MADKISETTAIMNELLGAFDKISKSQLSFVRDMNEKHEGLKQAHSSLTSKINSLLKDIEQVEQNVPKLKIKSKLTFVTQKTEPVKKPKTVKDTAEDKLEKAKYKKLDSFFTKKGSALKDFSAKSINISKSQIYIGKSNIPLGLEQKQSQSDLNYTAHDEIDPLELEQAKLLKEIRDSIGTLKGNGGSDDSLFGMLLGGFKDIVGAISKTVMGLGMMGAGGLAGAGLGAGLMSKFKFLGKFVSPLKKLSGGFGKGAKAILGVVKNPKIMLPMLAAGLMYGAYKGFNSDEVDELANAEQRMFGGPVDKNQLYVVGEKGPEFFRPNTDGTIIPMDPNKNDISEIMLFNRRLFRRVTNIITSIKDKFSEFVKIFTFKNLSGLIKNVIGAGVQKVKDVIVGAGQKLKNFGSAAKEKAVSVFSSTMNLLSGGENTMNLFSQQPVISPSLTPGNFSFKKPKPQIGGSYRIGTGRVPRDMNAQIHEGEMIFPKDMSDMLRAAAPLGEMLKTVATVSNQKNAAITLENNSKAVLPREFWMSVFIPKFAEMIKTKKQTSNAIMPNRIGNVFGVA